MARYLLIVEFTANKQGGPVPQMPQHPFDTKAFVSVHEFNDPQEVLGKIGTAMRDFGSNSIVHTPLKDLQSNALADGARMLMAASELHEGKKSASWFTAKGTFEAAVVRLQRGGIDRLPTQAPVAEEVPTSVRVGTLAIDNPRDGDFVG